MYCYIRFAGIEAPKFSTSVAAVDAIWDAKKQAFAGYSANAAKLNDDLSSVKESVLKIYNRLKYEGVRITAIGVRTAYMRERNAGYVTHNAIELYDEYIQESVNERLRLGYKENTLGKWKFSTNFFKDYVSSRLTNAYDVRDIQIKESSDYYKYLRNIVSDRRKQRMSISHCRRHIQYLRSFLEWCVDKKIIETNPIANWKPAEKLRRMLTIKISYAECMRMFLNEDLTLTERHVIDIYTFLMFTSLDYGDYKLAHKAIVKSMDVDGSEIEYFDWVRNKGRIDVEPSRCTIVLLPIAKQLLSKYKNGFPDYTNQGINKIVRRVASRLDIPNAEKLTTKTARKSFATMLLNEGGLRYEILKEIVGHESVTTTERHYAQINTRTVLRETAHLPLLFAKLSDKFLADVA